MKLLLALAAGRAAAVTDVFLASDRLAASAAVLNSVCDNSSPSQLRFHLLAPTREEAEALARETETACDGAAVEPYGLAEFEKQVRTLGEEPMWTTALSKVERSKSTYAVPVARWDRDKKHTSPYNHARFYAPQLIEGDTLVMLDDDVIVQGDVTTLKPQHKAVAAGCQQWYVNGDGFESSTDLSYADVPYFGYGVLSEERGDPSCAHEHATECVPGDARDWFAEVARTDEAVARRASWPRLLRRLAAIKDDAFAAPSPDDGDAFVEELRNARAWNFGLVVIDLDSWKQHKLTAKYTSWLEANYRREFFPSDSLAFGLGLPFLALRGEVECFEDTTGGVRFEQGLGVAPWVHTDRDTKTLDDAFALHWNGNRKPWDLDRCDEETRPYFLRYLARSPGLYGGHVAESHGDYYAKCAPPPPRPSPHRFLADRSSATKASVAGSAFASWDAAYAWYSTVYKFTPPKDITEGYTEADWPGMVRLAALSRCLQFRRRRDTVKGVSTQAITVDECEMKCADHFPSGRGVLACPKTELERNVLKWLWWHPSVDGHGAYGWVGNYRGTSASDAFDGCPRGAGTVGDGTAGVAGDAPASLGFVPDNGGECAIEERCAVLVGNGWVIEEKTWHKGESYEKTDRWKTGDINWPGDYVDDKSCGTGEYALPEKEVEENDSGEGTKTRDDLCYEHRRSVCLCEDAGVDSYDEDNLLATSPGLPLGSKALPCDDMLVYSEEKYDKTTTAEAFAIVFIVLIVVGGCIACSVFAFMSQRRQRMLYEENEKKRQAQLANAAPIVHAPPVVQPAVQQGYVQPGYAPQGQVVGAYPPAPPQPGYAPQYAPQPGYAPQAPMATGTVVQGGYAAQPGGYQPEGYKPEGY